MGSPVSTPKSACFAKPWRSPRSLGRSRRRENYRLVNEWVLRSVFFVVALPPFWGAFWLCVRIEMRVAAYQRSLRDRQQEA